VDHANRMKERLFSLDVLRGLDMLLLVVIGPLIKHSNEAYHWCAPWFIRQFWHSWTGFSLWDIIMPLFIFMCGAAIPFALTKRLEQGPKEFWKHVLLRVALLWFLGGLVQGAWASLDLNKIAWYSNTLQSIAAGYLITAAIMCTRRRWVAIVAAIAMAGVYAIFMAVGGDYTEYGNAAFKFEQPICEFLYSSNHVRMAKPSYYTWFPTTLMFGVMTLCGYLATEVLRTTWTKWRKAGVLFGYAAGLLILGFVSSIWIPVIKPVFTLSFTALAMGWSVLALAILYVICDIWECRRGWGPVLFFGQLALTAYFVSHFFRPVLTAFGNLMAQGILPHVAETSHSFVLEIFVVTGTIGVMYAWRKLKEKKV